MTRLNIPIAVRWGDLDAYGHVNNAAMLVLLEEARVRAFWSGGAESEEALPTAVLDGHSGAVSMTLIARQEIEYLAPVPYDPRPLDIQLWIGRLGGASLEVCYEIYSPHARASRVLYARASTTLVLVDATTQRPTRFGTREREAWAPYIEDRVVFTRR